ncbi:hypothetical protein C3D72_18100, partial [Cronobacter sakazakii]
ADPRFPLVFDPPRPHRAAGVCLFDILVDLPVFHTVPAPHPGPFRALKRVFSPAPPYPNWTAVGVNWLAGFDFEIKVIARIPDGPRA